MATPVVALSLKEFAALLRRSPQTAAFLIELFIAIGIVEEIDGVLRRRRLGDPCRLRRREVCAVSERSPNVIDLGHRAVFARWRKRCPYEAAIKSDPRADAVCRDCGTTFAWRSYGGLCGWCRESEEAATA
jgi:hypothetical protein